MARRGIPELCMICDLAPCECNKKPVRKAAAARVKASVEPPPVSREKLAPQRHAVSEEDLLLANAIRTLKEILHPDELARYSSILSVGQSLTERATAWRARRAG